MKANKTKYTINKLLYQKRRLLVYATALSLTATSLTGCSEEQLFDNITTEQRDDKQKQAGNEKNFSYDEIANSYYVSIYNWKEKKYEPYFCKEEKYIIEEGNSWIKPEEERSRIVDIDTQKEIAFGFDPTDPLYTIEGLQSGWVDETDFVNDKLITRTIVSACHENSNEKCLDPERRIGGCGRISLYHHLGSSYEEDHKNGSHYTNIYIFGKVKKFMDKEDKKNSYTKEEYKKLKKSIVKNWHIK